MSLESARLGPALVAAVAALVLARPVSVSASPLVYTPVNPSFGGSPLNGPVLLNEANAINDYKAPPVKQSTSERLDAFSQSLQNAILNRVSSAVIRNIVSEGGALIPGKVETRDFTIEVFDLGGGLVRVVTTDKTTGQTSTFEIGTPPP